METPTYDPSPEPVALIGDIHGCADELAELLARVGERPVISLGDIVDRGPDPAGAIAQLRARRARVVLGNHEDKHLRYRRHARRARGEPGFRNPMQLAPHHETTQRLVPDDAWAWLESESVPFLRLASHGALALHAGLLAGVSPQEHKPERICRVQLTKPGCAKSPHGNLVDKGDGTFTAEGEHGDWIEQGYRFWTEYLVGGEVAVYGHSVFPRPLGSYLAEAGVEHRACAGPQVPREGLVALGIDTGAPFGGALTALLLPEWTIVSVPAKRRYFAGRLEGD